MKGKYYLGLRFPSEREKEHAVKYLDRKTEKHKELLLRLIDCAYGIQNNKVLDHPQLDLLFEGMKQSSELVFCDYSGKFVSILSHNFIEAEQLLIRLAEDKSSQVRFNAVTILLYKPKESVTTYIIQKCISDKSSKVRKKVADICQRLYLKDMLPILESQRLIEENLSVKAGLDFSVSLIQNGFVTEDNDIDYLDLVIKMSNGDLKGIRINKRQLDFYQIQKIVDSIKEKNRLPWE